MKSIIKNQNNVIECTCGTILEYDKSDLALKNVENTNYYTISIVCPICEKIHTVKPAEFDDNELINSISSKKSLDKMEVNKLSLAANSPDAKDIFSIHDRRTITLKNGYNAVFEIIGIKHDIREDGKKAGLTFCLVDLYGTDENFDRVMNDESTNAGGFEKSTMFKWLNEDFFALFPDEWQKIIVPVVKKTANSSDPTAEIVDTICKVFIPSEIEVFGECHYSNKGEGEQYDGFKNWKDRLKSYPDGNYGSPYWLRSPHSGNDCDFCIVYSGGGYSYIRASGAGYIVPCGVAPCFAI